MTSIILITGLIIALSFSLTLNWWQKLEIKNLKSRYTQLYEQTESIGSDGHSLPHTSVRAIYVDENLKIVDPAQRSNMGQ